MSGDTPADITIEALTRLDLKPTEVLAVTVGWPNLTPVQLEQYGEYLSDWFSVRDMPVAGVLILPQGSQVAAITAPDGSSLGRCTSCGLPHKDCPISEPDAEWTTDANGNHDGLCCEDCQHNAETTINLDIRGNQSMTEQQINAIAQRIRLSPPSPQQETAMSFSFASIKAALVHFLGIEEAKAHDIVEAVIADATPVIAKLRADIAADAAQLAADAKADAEALYTEALNDIRAEIATIRSLINPATAAPATSAEPADGTAASV